MRPTACLLSSSFMWLLLTLAFSFALELESQKQQYDSNSLALCAASLQQADTNQDGILDRDEFQVFCQLEANRTPMMLFATDLHNIFATSNKNKIPPELMKTFDSMVADNAADSSSSSSSLQSIPFRLTDPEQEQTVLESLCIDVVSQISQSLEDQALMMDGEEGESSRQAPGMTGSSMPIEAPTLPIGSNPDVTAIPASQVGTTGPTSQLLTQSFGDLATFQPSAQPTGVSPAGAPVATPGETSKKKPNIIVIQPDDLVFFDAWNPPMNNPAQANAQVPLPKVGLPHIEALRTQGLQMMQAYTTAPTCGTSRFSTLTGRYASRSLTSRNLSEQKEQEAIQVVTIPRTKLTQQDCTTDNLAAALQQHGGYRTGMLGKWHLSRIKDADYSYDSAVQTVQECGFDTVDALYIENLVANPDEFNNYSDGTFSHNMEWLVAQAIEFINNSNGNIEVKDDEPFFMYFNPTVPHGSNDVKKAITDFSCRATPKGMLTEDPMIPGMTADYGGSCEDYRQSILDRAVTENDYGAIWLDDAVGAIVQALQTKGILDHTMILFQQDHGMEAKGALYETGVRIAQFLHYPDAFPAGYQLEAPVSTIDIAPTLLEYAGVTTPPYAMDGRSWKSVLETSLRTQTTKTTLAEDIDRCLFFEIDQDRAVRCGCYKYLQILEQDDSISPTYQSGGKKGLSRDLNNVFNLCGSTGRYLTGNDNGTANPEADGSNLFAVNDEISMALKEAVECHMQRTDPSVDPDYTTSCGTALEGGVTDQSSGNNTDAAQETETVKIETAFVLSNTQGLTASDIESQYLDSLIQAFQETIQDSGFEDLVMSSLKEQEEASNGSNEFLDNSSPGGGNRPNGGGGQNGGGPGQEGIEHNDGIDGSGRDKGINCPTAEQYVGTPSSTPQPVPRRGSIACVDVAAHALRDTDAMPIKDEQAAFNIYGPMEAGFTSSTPKMECLGDVEVPGGLDTNLAEHVVAHLCPDQNIQVLDACGGHAVPYHYHERMDCLYTSDPDTGHSTRIGTAGDGNGIYGKYIDGGVLPADLDVCGGRFGVTPDSNGEEVYYYPITAAAPFSAGCYGPVITVEVCRALYPKYCGEEGTIVDITTDYGSGKYTLDCPCFDENGSNVIGQGRPPFLAPLESQTGTNSRRLLLKEKTFTHLYRRGSPQLRRFLQEATIDLSSVAVVVEDLDCPAYVEDINTAACVTAKAFFELITDGSLSSSKFGRSYLKSVQDWISNGGYQDKLPDGSPFKMERVVRGGRGSSGKKKRLLVNSAFVISSLDGKTADELKKSMASDEVDLIRKAYEKLIKGVANELGSYETTMEEEEKLSSPNANGPTSGGLNNGDRPIESEEGGPGNSQSGGPRPNGGNQGNQGSGQGSPEGGRPEESDNRPNGSNDQGSNINNSNRPNGNSQNGQVGNNQQSSSEELVSDDVNDRPSGRPETEPGSENPRPGGDKETGNSGQADGPMRPDGPAPPEGRDTTKNNNNNRSRRQLFRRGRLAAPMRRRQLQGRRKFDNVGLDKESAEIYDFQDTPCSGNTQELTVSRQVVVYCITVFGKYRVFVDDEEDIEQVYNSFRNTTQEYISEGVLEESLLAVAQELNATVAFAVEGVSAVDDADFDAYAEFEDEDPPISLQENVSTSLPSVTNATAAPTSQDENSGSLRRHFALVPAALVALFVLVV